jgi:hypothetical protein
MIIVENPCSTLYSKTTLKKVLKCSSDEKQKNGALEKNSAYDK